MDLPCVKRTLNMRSIKSRLKHFAHFHVYFIVHSVNRKMEES